MPGNPAWDIVQRSVAEQANYLSSVLGALAGVCPVCFGAMPETSRRCHNCEGSWNRAEGVLADLVTPVTYRLGHHGQAAHDLRAYKADLPSKEAQLRLTYLFWYFCVRHIQCVKDRLDIAHFTHVAFVPSTRRAQSDHPLQTLLAPMIPLQQVVLRLNTTVDPSRRKLRPEMFSADTISPLGGLPPTVLLIDDTWVTGARVQSAAHRLKRAGADKVAVLVMARQVNLDYEPAQLLLSRVKDTAYNPEHCVWH